MGDSSTLNLAEVLSSYSAVKENHFMEDKEKNESVYEVSGFGFQEMSEKIETSFQGIGKVDKEWGLSIGSIKKKTRELTLKMLADKEGDLFKERQSLILKRFKGGDVSKAEGIKLRYLNWQLERLEDAQGGEFLDALEKVVLIQENLANEIMTNLHKVEKALPKSKKKHG